MVWIGKLAALVCIILAVAFEWKDLLGIGGEGGFTFIQKYTGFISPGVLPCLFWECSETDHWCCSCSRFINRFHLLAIFLTALVIGLLGHENILYTAFKNKDGVYEIPFLINMGWAFFFTMVVMIGISFWSKINPKAFMLDKEMFKLKPSIIAMIVATLIILSALYVKFW